MLFIRYIFFVRFIFLYISHLVFPSLYLLLLIFLHLETLIIVPSCPCYSKRVANISLKSILSHIILVSLCIYLCIHTKDHHGDHVEDLSPKGAPRMLEIGTLPSYPFLIHTFVNCTAQTSSLFLSK